MEVKDKEFWEEIRYEVELLIKKYTSSNEKKILIGSGNNEGKILFIGDDYDLYLNEDLKVLSGSSGEFLIKLCDLEEITPQDYYITTLAKSNFKYLELLEEDRVLLQELLHMQIALQKPKLIVTLGSQSYTTLTGKEIKLSPGNRNIENWIGNIKILPTYDVNFVKKSRNESGKKSKIALEFWSDLKKVREFLNENS